MASRSTAASLVVKIDSGALQGVASVDGSVRAYKGIPYAQPPVGDLRWRPPQPALAWRGIRSAKAFGPSCIQPSRDPTSLGFFGSEAQSEDCLTLNVWTAASSADERRPVMVWFHGGAYYLGSGAVPIFDGEQLARHGVVLVTVNYRLGRLGFLAHPALSQESPEKASGNYGLMDQIGALAWVRNNIAAFGGDPACVTIFGQSAGSVSVSCLLVAPIARGMFHRAIGQSGAAFGAIAPSSGTGDCMQDLESAEKSGLAFGAALGVSSAEALRALPAATLQLAGRGGGAGNGAKSGVVFDPALAPPGAWDTSYAIVDGYIVPELAADAFARGAQYDVPLLTGTTANEGATMPPAPSQFAFKTQVQMEFGPHAEECFKHYPARDDAQARYANKAMIGDRNFVYQNWRWARWQSMTGNCKAFYYRFHKLPPFPPDASFAEDTGSKLGAFHGSEIVYIFRNLQARDWPWRQTDRDLAATISSYWINFARSGDPNGVGLPVWPEFRETRQTVMQFGDYPFTGALPHRDRLEFWDAHYARMRGAQRK